MWTQLESTLKIMIIEIRIDSCEYKLTIWDLLKMGLWPCYWRTFWFLKLVPGGKWFAPLCKRESHPMLLEDPLVSKTCTMPDQNKQQYKQTWEVLFLNKQGNASKQTRNKHFNKNKETLQNKQGNALKQTNASKQTRKSFKTNKEPFQLCCIWTYQSDS